MDIKKGVHYSDIYLIPKMTIVDSRKECDTTVTLGKRTFDIPVVPANMRSVVDAETCEYLARKNIFYIMHRFEIDQVAFCRSMRDKGLFTSISMGVNEDSYSDLKRLIDEDIIPDYITVDVANGYSIKAKNMIEFIKGETDSFLIGGNVATSEGVEALEEWGCDATKAGIAGGKVCLTKNKTGFHVPMATTVEDCVRVAKKPLIADGGVVDHGDIAKAIALGATMVMAGSLFAGYDQSAGQLIEVDGKHFKEYYGSASQFNKPDQKYKNVEGKKILVEYKGDMSKLLTELKEDLQSSISYSGGRSLESLQRVKYISSH